MPFRSKGDVAKRHGISLVRLEQYERAGVLRSITTGDHEACFSELRVSVIAKAEQLGFTFDEIVLLLEYASEAGELAT